MYCDSHFFHEGIPCDQQRQNTVIHISSSSVIVSAQPEHVYIFVWLFYAYLTGYLYNGMGDIMLHI